MMTNRQEVAKKLRENSTVHTTDEAYVVLLNCMENMYDECLKDFDAAIGYYKRLVEKRSHE